ncbi:DUF6265 family protein [Rudanella lutea]|uniref:DUF6265 family protein n=1 Tax=Rudanella lutea TaxID=451374 RepID=UPI00035F409B|nr:DUF6265 family protein [Rudanella lutea]
MKTLRLLPLLLLLPFLSVAQSGKPATLAAVSFLEGHWRGTYNGGPIEAVWSAPEANNIIGFIRMMKNDKISLYELFAFEQTAAGPVAMVKHFKEGLIGWEEKDKSDRYRFLEASAKEALFEKEDGSIRIIYEKRTPDQLVIRRGEKKDANWAFSDLFVFNRVR